MANPGCVGNYANQLAERSANLNWQINTAIALGEDYYAGINNVTYVEAIKAYRFLKSLGFKMPITEEEL